MATFPLRKRQDSDGRYLTRGQEVLNLQVFLNRVRNHRGQPLIKEDGIFGPGTERAVQDFRGISEITEHYYTQVIVKTLRNYPSAQAQPEHKKKAGMPVWVKPLAGGAMMLLGVVGLYELDKLDK